MLALNKITNFVILYHIWVESALVAAMKTSVDQRNNVYKSWSGQVITDRNNALFDSLTATFAWCSKKSARFSAPYIHTYIHRWNIYTVCMYVCMYVCAGAIFTKRCGCAAATLRIMALCRLWRSSPTWKYAAFSRKWPTGLCVCMYVHIYVYMYNVYVCMYVLYVCSTQTWIVSKLWKGYCSIVGE